MPRLVLPAWKFDIDITGHASTGAGDPQSPQIPLSVVSLGRVQLDSVTTSNLSRETHAYGTWGEGKVGLKEG